MLISFNGNEQNLQGVFWKNFRPGGDIFPEISNFDRKSPFLAFLSHD